MKDSTKDAPGAARSGVRPRLSVTIPCRNEEKHIARCVNSFLNGTLKEIEVVVVDSASEDRSVEVVKAIAARDPRVKLVSNPARITPRAYNLGIQNSAGEFVATYGGHSIPFPDWGERNLAAIDAHPEVAGVGGLLFTEGESFIGRAVAAVQSCLFGIGNVRFRIGGPPGYVDTIVYACYRRSALDKHGLYDEQFPTNQDDELNLRLTAAGEKLWFDPSIKTTYFARPTWRKALDQYWRYGLYKFETFRKNGRVGAARHLAPAAFVAFLLAWIASAFVAMPLFWAGSAVMAVYFGLALYYAARSVPRYGVSALLFIPVALSVHLAYGLGTWYGAFLSLFGISPAAAQGITPPAPGQS